MTLLDLAPVEEVPTSWVSVLEKYGISGLIVLVILWAFVFKWSPWIVKLLEAGVIAIKTLAVAIPDIQASLKRIADHGEYALNELKGKLDGLRESISRERNDVMERLDERFDQLREQLRTRVS